MWFENLTCPCSHELKFRQKWRNFLEVILKIELPLSLQAEFFQKYDSFDDITWKFELPLLSRADNFAKIRQFSWSDFKNWIDSIIISWIFFKNMTVLMISHEIWPASIIMS